tara:strand:+ start:1922 stop:2974 length:1053 start_codon:yes stop_codon:yes gene_type:complete
MPLKVKDGIGAWIKDFQKSDAPQFKGRSKDQRRDQAIAAYLSAKRGPQNESTHYDYDKSVEKDIKKRNRKVESSLEYAKSIEKINKKKRDDLLKPGEKDKIDKMRKMMKKANEDIAGGLTRRIGSLSNVTGPNRSTALGQASKLSTQRSNIRAKNQAQRDIKKRMQMNSTNESIGKTPGDDSYHLLQKAKRMAAKDGHDYDKLPAYDRTHNKHRDYYDQKARNESVKEGMTTGNEAGMMFRVKIEGLPDMIMVGRSPSDIKQQLRKIVKQPSMINSVDRMPKSQVRKMYRDLAGGKDIDENYLHDYGTPESVKMMKNMTPGQASSMLDKIMKIRKGKNKKQLGKNDAVED